MTTLCWPNTVRTASSIVPIVTLQPFYFMDRISPAERGHGQDDGQAGFPGEGQREIRAHQLEASGSSEHQPVLRRLTTTEEFRQMDDLLGRSSAAKVAMVRSSRVFI